MSRCRTVNITTRPKKLTISAGDLNSCPRGVYYKKKNTPEPLVHPKIAETWQLFGRLQEMGQVVQKTITQEWITKRSLLSPERFVPWNDYVTGKYDAIVKVDGKPVLYEIKRAGKAIRESKKPVFYDEHRSQLIIYHYFLKKNFPGLVPKILYADLKSGFRIEIPVDYTEQEVLDLLNKAKRLKEDIENNILPDCLEVFSINKFTGKKEISMSAITCKYHALCFENDHWYPKALEDLEKILKAGED